MASAPALISMSWLLRLRWAAIGAYGALTAVAAAGGLDLPYGRLAALLALAAATNLALMAWGRGERPARVELAGSMLLLDTGLLTALLGCSGGPANPFSAFYLVHVTLAAVALGPGWAWWVAGASGLGFGALFWWHVPVPVFLHHGESGFSAHLAGMWIALTASALIVAHFVGRLALDLRRREADLARLRERAARHERLAALTTLAAGAAHELATPLATIALAASELAREMDAAGGSGAWAEDVRLVIQETRRCRGILDELSLRAGELPAEPAAALELGPWAEAFRAGLGPEVAARLEVRAAGRAVLPPRTLARILKGLVQNAVEASPSGARVSLAIAPTEAGVRFELADQGTGMSAEAAERAGEPFLTTKAGGMGLGLFLARLFTEQMGGRFGLSSTEGKGTTVTMVLPAGASHD